MGGDSKCDILLVTADLLPQDNRSGTGTILARYPLHLHRPLQYLQMDSQNSPVRQAEEGC